MGRVSAAEPVIWGGGALQCARIIPSTLNLSPGLTACFAPCSVRFMEQVNARAGFDRELVAAEPGLTAGYWFYFGFYWVSPAMLAERESRMT